MKNLFLACAITLTATISFTAFAGGKEQALQKTKLYKNALNELSAERKAAYLQERKRLDKLMDSYKFSYKVTPYEMARDQLRKGMKKAETQISQLDNELIDQAALPAKKRVYKYIPEMTVEKMELATSKGLGKAIKALKEDERKEYFKLAKSAAQAQVDYEERSRYKGPGFGKLLARVKAQEANKKLVAKEFEMVKARKLLKKLGKTSVAALAALGGSAVIAQAQEDSAVVDSRNFSPKVQPKNELPAEEKAYLSVDTGL